VYSHEAKRVSTATGLYRDAPRMATDVVTTVTELPESRVRVQAEVPAEEVERRVQQAARRLGRGLRVPGFRAGKAPGPVIVQRMGRDAVLDEAVRDSIGAWYTAAIDAARIAPVGEPQLDLGDLPAQGESLKFSIEIGVRPKAELGEYKASRSASASPTWARRRSSPSSTACASARRGWTRSSAPRPTATSW
jgi:trigger factor